MNDIFGRQVEKDQVVMATYAKHMGKVHKVNNSNLIIIATMADGRALVTPIYKAISAYSDVMILDGVEAHVPSVNEAVDTFVVNHPTRYISLRSLEVGRVYVHHNGYNKYVYLGKGDNVLTRYSSWDGDNGHQVYNDVNKHLFISEDILKQEEHGETYRVDWFRGIVNGNVKMSSTEDKIYSPADITIAIGKVFESFDACQRRNEYQYDLKLDEYGEFGMRNGHG